MLSRRLAGRPAAEPFHFTSPRDRMRCSHPFLCGGIRMNDAPSRRNFLAAGLALPAVASASRSSASPPALAQAQPQPPARPSGAALQYRTLGKTGLRVTTVGYGCMITSDPTVITRAVDMGINYFDTVPQLPGRPERAHGGSGLGREAQGHLPGEQMRQPVRGRASWRSSTPASRNSTPTTWTSGTCTA